MWVDISRTPDYDPRAIQKEMFLKMDSLGELAWEDRVELAKLGSTIIEGGFLRTELIQAKSIGAEQLNVDDLSAISGQFSRLMAGVPGEARLEMGQEGDDPFLRMYDSNSQLRVSLLQDRLDFHDELGRFGGSFFAYRYNDAGYDMPRLEMRTETDFLLMAMEAGADINAPSAYLHVSNIDNNPSIYMRAGVSLLRRSDISMSADELVLRAQQASGLEFKTAELVLRAQRVEINTHSGSTRYLVVANTVSGSQGSEPTLRPSHTGGWGAVGSSGFPFYQMHSHSFNQASSLELKTAIADLEPNDAYDKIKSLKVHRYKYKGKEEDVEHLGLISEEAPNELLSDDGKAVDLYAYISLVTAAVQEIQERLEKLEEASK